MGLLRDDNEPITGFCVSCSRSWSRRAPDLDAALGMLDWSAEVRVLVFPEGAAISLDLK